MGQFQDVNYQNIFVTLSAPSPMFIHIRTSLFDNHYFIDRKIPRRCSYFGYFARTLLKKSQECKSNRLLLFNRSSFSSSAFII